ncbi:MAG TPA: nickel-responsive transcriptional regulator NikR [Deltaproteobacteria bacterium]|mgnify:CR=1 FL=1|nr:nickel-responsive transcriptional regulator NikR [Deltaproteobacteria bacterium]HOM29819.1 nickel-responsive transcriptional regulator NikR [Deltaproteobacteria bacterium]HPP79390.1 nickel-responsive transcriptional regulator NikR [Deltaproteobacteria bacterium]
MSRLVRFGVSLESGLLEQFDRLIAKRGYTSRSEALRDLIRQELVHEEWEEDREVAGTVTFLYDHHTRGLSARLTDIQHDHQDLIISTQHIHLDHHTCLEIVAVRGRASDVLKLANALRSVKGVRHGSLSMSSTGKTLL